MDNKTILANQVIIMKALLSLVKDPTLIKEIKEQIIFTETSFSFIDPFTVSPSGEQFPGIEDFYKTEPRK